MLSCAPVSVSAYAAQRDPPHPLRGPFLGPPRGPILLCRTNLHYPTFRRHAPLLLTTLAPDCVPCLHEADHHASGSGRECSLRASGPASATASAYPLPRQKAAPNHGLVALS